MTLICFMKWNFSLEEPQSMFSDKRTPSNFRKRFRMSKESFHGLVELDREDLTKDPFGRGNPVPLNIRVLLALRFYATGSFQGVVGDTFGYPQGTVSRIIAEVSEAICKLYPMFVKFPINANAHETQQKFYRLVSDR